MLIALLNVMNGKHCTKKFSKSHKLNATFVSTFLFVFYSPFKFDSSLLQFYEVLFSFHFIDERYFLFPNRNSTLTHGNILFDFDFLCTQFFPWSFVIIWNSCSRNRDKRLRVLCFHQRSFFHLFTSLFFALFVDIFIAFLEETIFFSTVNFIIIYRYRLHDDLFERDFI